MGTVVLSRKCMPVAFKETKRSERGVLAITCSDHKKVHIITTCHKDIDMQIAKVVKRGDKEEKIKKPKCVIEYNGGMLCIPYYEADQLLSSFNIMRRTIKAYKKIFCLPH